MKDDILEKTDSILKSFRLFIKDVFLFNRLKAFLTLAFMVLVGVTNGLGIAALIPLLQVAGFGEVSEPGGYLSKIVVKFFSLFNLSPSLAGVLIVFFIIFLSTAILQYQQLKLSSALSHNYSAHLRGRLYENIFNAQWPFFIMKKMAHSANILTVEAQRIRIALDSLIRIVSESFITIAYIVLAFLISWQTTVIVVFAGAAVTWLMRRHIHSGKGIGKGITDANNELQSAVLEHLGSAKVIKSYSAEKQAAGLFHKLVSRVSDLYIRYLVNQAGIKAIFEPVTVGVLCVGLYVALTFFKMDTAYLLVLLFIFYRLSPKITLIQQNYHQLLTTIPAYNALISLEEETSSTPEYLEGKTKVTSFKKGIFLENVSFTYQSEERDIIEDINISIPYGKTVALVGESGSGKSTIADLILGLLLPTGGKIQIDDLNIRDIDIKSWRSLIGYVTQDTILFHDSVRANLLWANPDATDKDISDSLQISAADDFVRDLPEGYSTIIGDRGLRLSGGQRQRLALARALLRKPELLILDEATSSLDTESENRIQEAIESLRGSITMLVITHRLATVRNADIIYVIDDGKIVESGSWDSLLKSETGYFRNMCELQGLI